MRIDFNIPFVFTRDSSPTEDARAASILRATFDRIAQVLHPKAAPVRDFAVTGAGVRELCLDRKEFPALGVFRGQACWELGFDVFHRDATKLRNALVLNALMACLTSLDVLFLDMADERGVKVPELYDAGVVYDRTQSWDTIPTLYRKKYGDCKSVSAALCAERIRRGDQAVPEFRWMPNERGDRDFHILVRTPFGVEDPSKVLGMGSNENGPVRRRA